jgi:NAD(P)-dependent dehydrogenase (short-subunit alcohol dehydrogenase family)
MSKHALVAYSNTLRLEMKKWNVGVCIVEPTGFLTGKDYSLFCSLVYGKDKGQN